VNVENQGNRKNGFFRPGAYHLGEDREFVFKTGGAGGAQARKKKLFRSFGGEGDGNGIHAPMFFARAHFTSCLSQRGQGLHCSPPAQGFWGEKPT